MSIVSGHCFEFYYSSDEAKDKIKKAIAAILSAGTVFKNLTVRHNGKKEIAWYEKEGMIGFQADSEGCLFHRSKDQRIFDSLLQEGLCTKLVMSYWPDEEMPAEAVICIKEQDAVTHFFREFPVEDVREFAMDEWFEDERGDEDAFNEDWEERYEEIMTGYVRSEIDDFSPDYPDEWKKI